VSGLPLSSGKAEIRLNAVRVDCDKPAPAVLDEIVHRLLDGDYHVDPLPRASTSRRPGAGRIFVGALAGRRNRYEVHVDPLF